MIFGHSKRYLRAAKKCGQPKALENPFEFQLKIHCFDFRTIASAEIKMA